MKHEKGQMPVVLADGGIVLPLAQEGGLCHGEEVHSLDVVELKKLIRSLPLEIHPIRLRTQCRALDVCCGGRMMYYDHQDPRVIFCDNRETHTVLCDGRSFDVRPDVLCDFRSLPFGDETAPLVIFDPPHLRKAGDSSWLAQKYGLLPSDGWKEYLADGFKECWRVLSVGGTLIFKWSEDQIKMRQIADIFPAKPLFGNRARNNKTIFIVFFKDESEKYKKGSGEDQ